MAQYRDLNAPPQRTFADIVAEMRDQAKSSKTGASGVKDLGETGDIVWPRWDGGEDSVREVSANVEAAREAVADLNDRVLPELSDELESSRIELQQKLDAANARIDDIIVDGGGAGNFTTYSTNPPDADGTGAGDTWYQHFGGSILGQWRWDGAAWVSVQITDYMISGITLSKLISTGNLSEVVARKMFADIFNANKITSQEIAAGSITTEKIAAEGIVADVIQGGSFVGETFEGGTFTGGLFKTSDALPGRVEFADDAYVTHLDGGSTGPGLRIVPADTSNINLPAAIGPSADGVTLYGGRSTSGGASVVECSPTGVGMGALWPNGGPGGWVQTSLTESYMRTSRENGLIGGAMQTSLTESFMRTRRADGSIGGTLQASPTSAFMRTHRPDGSTGGEIQTSLSESFMRTTRENGVIGGTMQTSPTSAFMRTRRENGSIGGEIRTDAEATYARTLSGNSSESGWVQVRPKDAELAYVDPNNVYFSRVKADANEAFIYTRAGGADRYLTVDANGVWVKTNESGSWQNVSLVPQVRPFQYSAQWNADQSPAPIMVQHLPGGKLCQAQIRIQNLSGSSLSLPYDTWVAVNYNPIPADLRGGFTDYIEVTLPQLNARGRVEMNYSTGRIRVKALHQDSNGNPVTIAWTNNNSIWFPMRWFSPD